ncbi:MAG: FAD binding domain-containing protein [Candidatus Heimdallarchaeum endolithica]|uniref:FAD binding domain-containing protein n=1 Tax=Candidatus Heimdallarchaeum endolithica TaxID=2876572 RepID=A0A9Y1FN70_9ARCH|nr:MAG: FAD binding domain-containing protein [Candidatus Heimdallarchaeum endolithica]
MKFILNNKIEEIDAPLGSSTLDFLRKKGFTGVKEACHEGECGACMILLGEMKGSIVKYKAVTSCILPLGEIIGKHVVTIEGINQEKLTPIQEAIVEEGASQCGFCTPGFVMSLTGFFLNENFVKEDILTAIEGNLCRCGTYAAIKRAAEKLAEKIAVDNLNYSARINYLIELGVIPDYFKDIPAKLEELNEKLETNDKGIKVAGATDLLVQRKEIGKPVFLNQMEIRDDIWEEEEYIYIGALASMEDIRLSKKLNELFDIKNDLTVVSALPIRIRATLGGNLVNASPIGDLTIYFLGLGAEISLRKGEKRRIIALKDFYKGYKQMDLEEGEIVEWLRIKSIKRYFNFEKIAMRKYVDIASVNSAISFEKEENKIKNVHLSIGGVAPVPKYLEKTSSFLNDKKVNSEVVNQALEIADSEISPISDVRGSAKYKRLLVRQLIIAHFMALFPKMEVKL